MHLEEWRFVSLVSLQQTMVVAENRPDARCPPRWGCGCPANRHRRLRLAGSMAFVLQARGRGGGKHVLGCVVFCGTYGTVCECVWMVGFREEGNGHGI
jgi:hypothetical protein